MADPPRQSDRYPYGTVAWQVFCSLFCGTVYSFADSRRFLQEHTRLSEPQLDTINSYILAAAFLTVHVAFCRRKLGWRGCYMLASASVLLGYLCVLRCQRLIGGPGGDPEPFVASLFHLRLLSAAYFLQELGTATFFMCLTLDSLRFPSAIGLMSCAYTCSSILYSQLVRACLNKQLLVRAGLNRQLPFWSLATFPAAPALFGLCMALFMTPPDTLEEASSPSPPDDADDASPSSSPSSSLALGDAPASPSPSPLAPAASLASVACPLAPAAKKVEKRRSQPPSALRLVLFNANFWLLSAYALLRFPPIMSLMGNVSILPALCSQASPSPLPPLPPAADSANPPELSATSPELSSGPPPPLDASAPLAPSAPLASSAPLAPGAKATPPADDANINSVAQIAGAVGRLAMGFGCERWLRRWPGAGTSLSLVVASELVALVALHFAMHGLWGRVWAYLCVCAIFFAWGGVIPLTAVFSIDLFGPNGDVLVASIPTIGGLGNLVYLPFLTWLVSTMHKVTKTKTKGPPTVADKVLVAAVLVLLGLIALASSVWLGPSREIPRSPDGVEVELGAQVPGGKQPGSSSDSSSSCSACSDSSARE